jgi:hypothetical protein
MNIKFILIGAAVASATLSHAIVPISTLKSTGDSVTGGQQDTNYTIVSGPITGDVDVAHPGFFALNGAWVSNTATAKWIAPASTVPTTPGAIGTAPAGDYVYKTTFDLSGLIASTANITGKWASDNTGLGIYLNGNLVSGTGGGTGNHFGAFRNFAISSGFVDGVNTLEFHVRNASGASGNPTGLIVDMSGTAQPVPEPATLAALGAGLLAFRRRNKK